MSTSNVQELIFKTNRIRVNNERLMVSIPVSKATMLLKYDRILFVDVHERSSWK